MSMRKRQRAIAVFDCVADDDKELSFNKGDVIVDIKPAADQGDDWFLGRVTTSLQVGLFPGNYVKFVSVIESEDESDEEDHPTPAAAPAPPTSTLPKAHSPMAAYSSAFKSANASFKEKVAERTPKIQDRVDKLYKSAILSTSRSAPIATEKPVQPSPVQQFVSQGQTQPAAQPQGLRAIALFDCVGDIPEELSFKKGNVLVDVKPAPEEGDAWFRGRIESTATFGLFPGNYVKFEPATRPSTAPFIPAKPLDLKSSIKPSAPAPTLPSQPDSLSPVPKQAPWMSQVTLKPILSNSSTPASAFSSTSSTTSTPSIKRAPPPPPPSSNSLNAKFAAIGLTSTPQSQTRTSKPPPPPPQSKPVSALATFTTQQPSPEHQILYESAFREFAKLLNPGSTIPVDSLMLSARQVRTVWLRSRLSNRELGEIWSAVVGGSEITRMGLSKQEFCRGLYLIDAALAKKAI
ncbi:hypothetical protein HDU98_006954 [Podochytrium sp. JEL0797]|nr:hypothetical protein HDU98_006954 [Podochytrium sp. JEL0797]